MRVLILGGTSEARALAARLADEPAVAATLSLAGRTVAPLPVAIPTRSGGFGGVEGLVAHLQGQGIAAVVDATHPFAARISAHAAAACERLGLPRALLTRPPWHPAPGDLWQGVPDLAAAVAALGTRPTRVFLTTGRLGLAAFGAAPQHRYLIRSIDAPDPRDCPPDHHITLERGPFTEANEIALMRHHAVAVVVSKNSGGPDGKIAAARHLGLPVIMVDRPPLPAGPVLLTVEDALAWLRTHAPGLSAPCP